MTPASAGRGLFVALEGIDGAGKTTAAAAAAEVLRQGGHGAVAAGRTLTDGVSNYVADHLAQLRELIWGEPADAPYLELGDDHWVHLHAAWYHAFAQCVVMPLVRSGSVVIVDTWGFKFLAKLKLRPRDVVDFDAAAAVLAAVPQPDLTVYLRTDAQLAAQRKPTMSGSETGNREGVPELSRQTFATYQNRLAKILEEFAGDLDWAGLETARLRPHETGVALAEIIKRHVGSADGAVATKETLA